MPRFEYEKHLADLAADPPRWPESTRRISQLRLTIEYASTRFWKRQLGRERLHIDIVDYPGEWLLDLPLLELDYRDWSRTALEQSRTPARKQGARRLARGARRDRSRPRPPTRRCAETLADLFKAYLREARADRYALSTLPPGRFLMPGDLAGSPALTFAPLDAERGDSFPRGSLWAMMERRYEAYKTHVVRPFFRDHFARLDRQIVLIDVLDRAERRTGRGRRPRARHDRDPRMLPDRARTACGRACSPRASTASCSPPPRPTICTIKATTGSKRSSPGSPGGPWRAPNMPAPR